MNAQLISSSNQTSFEFYTPRLSGFEFSHNTSLIFQNFQAFYKHVLCLTLRARKVKKRRPCGTPYQ